MKCIFKLFFITFLSSVSYANNLEIDGTIEVSITPSQQTSNAQPLIFALPHYKLSPQALHSIKEKLADYNKHGTDNGIQPVDLPRHVNVGMQGTPVLNQGRHGSCVTFAITGAIDALLGAGDYISQLCNLELGSQLAIDGKLPFSGWNGNYGSLVLQQIDQYGIISQNYQKLEGCAGVRDYPLKDAKDLGHPMSESEFTQHSIDISKLYSWEVLMFNEGWLIPSSEMNTLIIKIKKELAKGNLLTFGVLLDTQLGHAGAMGQYHVLNDTWMLTPQIVMDGPLTAGHDMVITGYDDDAVVLDAQGYSNQGIFFLRNSWSSLAGDNGNYYVSYDYFKYLTQEVHLFKLKNRA